MICEGKVLVDGLLFPEGPRWHDGRLWFSDMHAGVVLALNEDGSTERIVEVEASPSGLGWLPDGRLLVVSMTDRRLLRAEPDGSLSEVADLSSHAPHHCNDMIVDHAGRAYVGNFGFDLHAGAGRADTTLVLVTPEGRARVVADELAFPNGTVITPDGLQLIIAETFAARLTAFDIAADGSLSNRRVWATLDGAVPDGIWVASPISGEVLRVEEGGAVSERIAVATQAFACMLGGADGRTLFVCTAEDSDPAKCLRTRSGRIEAFRVAVPHAGLP